MQAVGLTPGGCASWPSGYPEFQVAQALKMTGAEDVRWNLSDLFASPDDPKIEAALARDLERAKAFEATYKGKVATLAPMYGQGVPGMARRLGCTPGQAGKLRKASQKAFPVYWSWAKDVVDEAKATGRISTNRGWGLTVGSETRVTTLRNFLMQSSGAESQPRIPCGRCRGPCEL